MKNLITILTLIATVALAKADYPKPRYQPVVDISEIHPYAKLDAWREYRKARHAQFAAGSTKAKAKQATEQATKPVPLTAESLFAAKMAERHAAK
jgi:hypothetical protein